MKFGSITTGIVSDGLIFNMDAANRASYIESADKAYNTIDTAASGTFQNDTQFNEISGIKSFQFDGVDDRISCGSGAISDPYYNLGPKTTCNIWVKYNNTTSAILVGGSNYVAGGYFFYANPSSATTSYKSSYDSATWTTFGTGVWINYCVTKDDNGSVVWYGNGQQLATGTVTSDADIGFWGIGAYSNPSGASYGLNGNLGPIQIYTHALSSNEVLHNYNALKGRFT